MLCSFTMLRIEAKDLLRYSSGQPNIQAVLDTYGAAEPILRLRGSRIETLCSSHGSLRMARRGVRWIANREVCSGYINSGNALVIG
jgi:hypothetical protein